jgi:hypothetical protein
MPTEAHVRNPPIADIRRLWDFRVMRGLIPPIAVLLLSACSTAEERQHSQLMDQIEKQVRMPAGSRPLAEYARYYAFDKRGRVVAIYTTLREPSYESLNLPAGQRRWVSHEDRLPGISDGGCGVVEVLFDPATEQVTRAECNGLA